MQFVWILYIMVIYHISYFCRFSVFCLPVDDFCWLYVNFPFYVIEYVKPFLWVFLVAFVLGQPSCTPGSVVHLRFL